MPTLFELVEPQPPQTRMDVIPIRQAYFPRAFWEFWDQLEDRGEAAYILGWIVELEMVVRRISEQMHQVSRDMEGEEP